jgi:peroxin-4
MSTSNTCIKRLKKEILKLVDSPDDFITLSHDKDDIRAWSAVIRAPPDSVYQGFLFDVGIEVGPDYPLAPPTMKFLTKIFHPNVHYEVLGDLTLLSWSYTVILREK